MKKSRLELTKINLRFNRIKHAMRTTLQVNRFAKASSSSQQPLHEMLMFVGPHVQINSTIIQPFHEMHFMTSWRLAFPGITHEVTYNPFCYYKGCFELYVVVLFKLSCPLTQAAYFLLLQIFTFAMTQAQVGK